MRASVRVVKPKLPKKGEAAKILKKLEPSTKKVYDEPYNLTKDWKHKVRWKRRFSHNQYVLQFSNETNDEIFGYWNNGTRPHIIRARYAQALRWEEAGEAVFAKWVEHPGTEGTHWWQDYQKRTRAWKKLAKQQLKLAMIASVKADAEQAVDIAKLALLFA